MFVVYFVELNEIVVEYKARDTHLPIYNSKPRVGYRKQSYGNCYSYRLSVIDIVCQTNEIR